MPASSRAGLATNPQAVSVSGVSPRTSGPWLRLFSPSPAPAEDEPLPPESQKPKSCPSLPTGCPPCLAAALPAPTLHPESQAASARPAGSTGLCPLPFSRAQRAVPAWLQFSSERCHGADPPAGMRAAWPCACTAWDGEQRSCLVESQGVAAAAPQHSRGHGAILTLGMVTLRMLGCAELSVTSLHR